MTAADKSAAVDEEPIGPVAALVGTLGAWFIYGLISVRPPSADEDGSLRLLSTGRAFGDSGFYRVQERDAARVRVWHIQSLQEKFHVYVDHEGVLRCDHHVHFLGLPVLKLHYKIFKR